MNKRIHVVWWNCLLDVNCWMCWSAGRFTNGCACPGEVPIRARPQFVWWVCLCVRVPAVGWLVPFPSSHSPNSSCVYFALLGGMCVLYCIVLCVGTSLLVVVLLVFFLRIFPFSFIIQLTQPSAQHTAFLLHTRFCHCCFCRRAAAVHDDRTANKQLLLVDGQQAFLHFRAHCTKYMQIAQAKKQPLSLLFSLNFHSFTFAFSQQPTSWTAAHSSAAAVHPSIINHQYIHNCPITISIFSAQSISTTPFNSLPPSPVRASANCSCFLSIQFFCIRFALLTCFSHLPCPFHSFHSLDR